MKGKKDCYKRGGMVGGNSNPPVSTINVTGSKVYSEAKERKRGGKVHGMMAKKRLDRPGRKSGGRVGADTSPLSSAAKMNHSAEG